jgi:hypothetical protein
MFDRRTTSLWYPIEGDSWTAISGPRKGQTIPFISKPVPMKLGEWRKVHPDTVVLLGSKARIEETEKKMSTNAARAAQEDIRFSTPDDRYREVHIR